jgi:hypothetical protein
MKNLILAIVAAAALGTAAFSPAEAQMSGPGCHNGHCIHGIIVHRRPVCERWEIFGGRRHCVRWLPAPL